MQFQCEIIYYGKVYYVCKDKITSEMQQLSVFPNLLFGEWAIKLQACPYLTRL